MEFSDDLIKLFESDNEGIFTPRQKIQAPSADDRLSTSFREIVEFVERNDRMPELESNDISEASLASRLNSIRNNRQKVEALKPIDSLGLLEMPEAPKSMDDLFEKDTFGLFESSGDDILNIKNVPNYSNRSKPDLIAKRKYISNFDDYKKLFKEKQSGLANGNLKLVRFKNVKQLVEGGYYVTDGQMVFVEKFGNAKIVYGRSKERIKAIFENGTESNMFLRSLSSQLYENGYIVADKNCTDISVTLEDTDNIKGYIYVLKSDSNDPKITTIKDLHKIGFSTAPVAQRIKDAEKDPTYLMASVEVVDSYILTGDYNPQKVEYFLHRVFADAKVEMNIIDKFGVNYVPSEWYSVPLATIEQAVNLLHSGDIINYHYDVNQQRILENS